MHINPHRKSRRRKGHFLHPPRRGDFFYAISAFLPAPPHLRPLFDTPCRFLRGARRFRRSKPAERTRFPLCRFQSQVAADVSGAPGVGSLHRSFSSAESEIHIVAARASAISRLNRFSSSVAAAGVLRASSPRNRGPPTTEQAGKRPILETRFRSHAGRRSETAFTVTLSPHPRNVVSLSCISAPSRIAALSHVLRRRAGGGCHHPQSQRIGCRRCFRRPSG